MHIQKSYHSEETSTVYVIPTPIGNLEDITFRALHKLKTADVIAAEDTRNTKNLLRHFDIDTPLISYHEHNKEARELELVERLEKGENIALVSDAGMPAISDPGFELIQAAIKSEKNVVVLPGANAALCALVGSGLPTSEFLFYGFLPRKKKAKEEELARLNALQATLLFYESPYRLKETFASLLEVLGDRHVVLTRELTKRFEEWIRGKTSEVMSWLKENDVKGECVIVVEGNSNHELETNILWWSHLSVKEHVVHYIEEEKMHSKDAIKRVAKERQMPKREVYHHYHLE